MIVGREHYDMHKSRFTLNWPQMMLTVLLVYYIDNFQISVLKQVNGVERLQELPCGLHLNM